MGPCQSSEAAGKPSRQPLVVPMKGKAAVGGHDQVNRYVNAQLHGSEASADSTGKSLNSHPKHDGYSSDSAASAISVSNGYASGASTPVDNLSLDGSGHNSSGEKRNPKSLAHSTSAIGLDTMIEVRKEEGGISSNVVHIEVPFGKPIEEVYDGVHGGPVLGSGISGLVRLVTHKATGVKYAVKCLDLGLVESAEGLQQLREEIFIMCQLDHPNIIRLEEVYESHSEIYLVQELCLGGELFDRLDEQPDYHYTEAECARLVKQMLCAVRYLHSKGIIHRDLKLENFLFSSTAADSELKMIDFGLSKHFKFGEVHHEAVGTPYTVAPEVIRGTYDERCDIWAIGVITFLLLSGDPPFGGCGGPEPLMIVRSNILRGHYVFEPEDVWVNVSEEAKSFIRELLVIDPAKRPTARNAQKHPWLKGWANREIKESDKRLNPNVVKALVNFKEFSDMRKLLCEVLSFTLLPEQIKDLRREFEKMDTDGSGEISLTALKKVLLQNAGAGSLGALTEAEVEDVFNAMRVRKTETRIHWHEFIAASLSQCQVDGRNLRLAFDRLDSDHKGYITLDDIMDLMGTDVTENEEALHQMWRDSMMTTSVPHSTRITYDDFLLLMKGQTRDSDNDLSMSSIKQLGGPLEIVPEVQAPAEEEGVDSGLVVAPVPGEVKYDEVPEGESADHFIPSIQSRRGSNSSVPSVGSGLRPKATSPLTVNSSDPDAFCNYQFNRSSVMDDEFPRRGSMDGVFRQESGPGVPGSSASLTPPQSPKRGPTDYVTPLSGRRPRIAPHPGQNLEMPNLPSQLQAYERRRSRSVDDQDGGVEEPEDTPDTMDGAFGTDARRAMSLPEHEQTRNDINELVRDDSKSALVVNRKLYRAHRQMRLAVLEASKRFEENQTRRARETLMAQSDDGSGGMIQAGLVMRHGIANQVSSEAIRKLLQDNAAQQQALVEKANKRGGRGRRTRKKTISDMSGMLSSMGQDELLPLAAAAAAIEEGVEVPTIPRLEETKSWEHGASESQLDLTDSPKIRGATIPGEFRRTEDPFSARGRYGAAERFGADILSQLERPSL